MTMQPSLVIQKMDSVLALQQEAFRNEPMPSCDVRKARLSALKKQICRYQDVIAEAASLDFGHRAVTETKLLDVVAVVLHIDHAIKSLKKWMKPSARSVELLFATNKVEVRYQPKGVVGVIGAWNFPGMLALGPLITSLAAGNRVMLKMSEFSPAVSHVLKQMLSEIFPEDLVCVFDGEAPEAIHFSQMAFNHLVFTGSPAVGRHVMQAAAKNLTPVTLELGGKSPGIVSRSYPLQDAAKRIVHSKVVNSGQICVAVDYALVPEGAEVAFVEACRMEYQTMVPTLKGNEHCTSIVDQRQHKRLMAILEDAEAKGASLHWCSDKTDGLQMPLCVVTDVTPDMRIATEELFGPILPVMTYQAISEAIHYVQENERPLALYIFSHDKEEREQILTNTHSGGVSINDWGWHAVNHDAPFGGVGNSGMGSYHGIEGFRELSHARTIFKRHKYFPIGLFYPPYGTKIQHLAASHVIGESDTGVEVDLSAFEKRDCELTQRTREALSRQG